MADGDGDGDPDLCPKCNKSALDDGKTILCDGVCGRRYHVGCVKLNVTKLKKIIELDGLVMWVCADCKQIWNTLKLVTVPRVRSSRTAMINNHKEVSESVAENVDAILEKVTNIEKVCNNAINQEDIQVLKTEILANIKMEREQSTAPSFSQIIKDQAKNRKDIIHIQPYTSSVIIKPRKVQSAEITKLEVTTQINPTKIGIPIKGIKTISNGGVIISTSDSKAAETLLAEAQEKLNEENYEAYITKPLQPKIKILGVDRQYGESELFEELMMQNHFITEEDNRIKIQYSAQSKKTNKWIITIEVKGNTFRKIMNAGEINVGWTSCKVVEDLYIKQCFSCYGFGHKRQECKRNPICPHCTGEHEGRNCKETTHLCTNCDYVNKKYNGNLESSHSATSDNCQLLRRRKQKCREQTSYDIN